MIAEDAATLDGVSLVGGKLIASYLVDAKTEVRVHDLDGKLIAQGRASRASAPRAGFGGDAKDTETFFAFTSFNRPTTIYRYDVGERRGARVAGAQARVQSRRLCGRAALLRVEGRHQGADVHRPQEGHHRPGADPALRLWRVQRLADARLSRRRGWRGSRRAAPSSSPTFAAAANMARRGTTAGGSPTSRMCSTTSSPRANI